MLLCRSCGIEEQIFLNPPQQLISKHHIFLLRKVYRSEPHQMVNGPNYFSFVYRVDVVNLNTNITCWVFTTNFVVFNSFNVDKYSIYFTIQIMIQMNLTFREFSQHINTCLKSLFLTFKNKPWPQANGCVSNAEI